MQPNPLSSKTTFERWLTRFPPTHDPRYNAIRSHRKQWGPYLRRNYPLQFGQLYEDFWLKHPEEWPKAYD